jgi:putative inorganic carbon (HCO3(-)) transporter
VREDATLPRRQTPVLPVLARFDRMHRVSWQNNCRFLLILAGLLLSLAYLLTLPAGLTGLLATTPALACVLAGANRKTIGVYFLLFGPMTLGVILRSFNLPYAGAYLSAVIGFLLLYLAPRTRPSAARANWRVPSAWLLLTVLVVVMFYFRGPQTEYSQSKLRLFLILLPVSLIALEHLVSNRDVSMWHLGMLGIVSAAVYYAGTLYQHPGVAPSSIWMTAGARFGAESVRETIASASLGLLGSYGIVLLVSSMVDARPRRSQACLSILALGIGVLVVNSAGQRLFWMTTCAGVLAPILCRPRNRLLPWLAPVLVVGVFGAIIFVGLKTENKFVTGVLGRDREMLERLNRSDNWRAAFSLIAKKPLLGHGLGGYYVEGYSLPGEGTYAHNLFLELLTETGMLGTALLLYPILYLFLIPRGKYMRLCRTANGGTLLPLLVAVFLHAMISHDLRQSFLLFSVLAVQWAHLDVKEKPVSAFPRRV